MIFSTIADSIHIFCRTLFASIFPKRKTELILSNTSTLSWQMTVLPECIVACGYYTDTLLHAAITELKFHRSSRAAQLLAPHLGYGIQWAITHATHTPCIITVPPSKRRMKMRGFDHLKLLMKYTMRYCNGATYIDGIEKIRETADQIHLSRKDRLKNLNGAFKAMKRFEGKSVILVDDVYTTGATAAACEKALVAAGASQVIVCVCAHA